MLSILAAAAGSLVTVVTATDVDKYPPLLYDFTIDGNPGNKFAINKFTGEITLLSPVDHEEQRLYTLELMVSDGRVTAQANQIVYIMDVNDNAPHFSHKSYKVNVAEGTPANRDVLQINADDLDDGINARIIYSLTGSDVYSINSSTGNKNVFTC